MLVSKVENDVYSFENFKEEDLTWKNFSAEKRGKFDPAYPNFDIYIPEDLANELREKGVNVKLTEPRDAGDVAKYRVNVKINMNYYREPEVYIRKEHGEKEYLNADTLYILDRKEITYGELLVKLNRNPQSDVATLYANVLGVKVMENPFDAKWAEEEYPGEDDNELPFR